MAYSLRSWVLIILIFLLAQVGVNAQYSQATQDVLDVSILFTYQDEVAGFSKEQLWAADKETTGRNRFKAKFLKGIFLSSIRPDSALLYFAEAKKYGEKIGINYDSISLIDYSIAEMYFRINKTKIAGLYLNKVINNTSDSDYMHWLARIKRVKRFPNLGEIEAIKKSIVNKPNSEISVNLKRYLIIQFLVVFREFDKLDYFRSVKDFFVESNDHIANFIYFNVGIATIRAHSNNRRELVDAIDSAKDAFHKLKTKSAYFNSRYQQILSEEYASKGLYYEANYATALACTQLGIDTSLNFDINVAGLSMFQTMDLLSKLAVTKLYLGPKNIEQAFEIFYRLANKYLLVQTSHLTGWDIAGQQSLEKRILISKILYIANYIYAETGDRSYLNRALALVDATRGATLYSQLFRRDAIRKGGGLSKLLKEDLELSRKEYQLSQEEDDGTLLNRMVDIQQERQQVMADIAAKYPDYLEQRSMLSPDFIGEQQARLAESGSSMLYFLHHDNFSFRILINADSVQTDNLYHRVLDKNDLPDLMANYPDCVNQSPGIDGKFSDECKTSGYALYQRLFGDIENQLEEKILIIGDGPFTNFPFSSLPSDEGGTDYVGTRHSITYNVSARLQRIMEAQRVNPEYHEVLAFSPSSETNTFALERGRETMSGLLNTKAELDAIEAILPGYYFRGAEATSENLLKEITNYEVIHLASHASADANDGRMSYLVLNREKDDISSPLYAVELSEQELNAEMVVLSACETGSGSDHLSEGTLGLTHAFTAAGARSVVSSRWSVDDAATAELMSYFYTHIHEGLEKDESLRLAQRDYRFQHAGTYRAHPYYWSAFVFSGNTGSITFPSSAGKLPVKWLVIGAASILLGVFAWQKKKTI